MERICGNCGNEMERLNDTQFYCEKCDETFTVMKGKQTVAKKKNLLDQIKEKFEKQDERIQKIEDSQKPEGDLFGL